ncbi:MAG: hypothetical protein GC159_19110 [Phycisphaera sp.]|nr:hypothetical protein [Phycisphaera sp.]
MPIDGFPDNEMHCFCMDCHQWHEPAEGRIIALEGDNVANADPINAVSALGRVLSGIGNSKQFICYACIQRRRRRRATIITVLGLAIVVAVIWRTTMT